MAKGKVVGVVWNRRLKSADVSFLKKHAFIYFTAPDLSCGM